jgi:transcription elongation factor Elf1
MKEEKIKPKFLEKWEKESYEKGWKEGREKLIKEIDKLERIKSVVCGKCGQSLDVDAIEIKNIKKLISDLK